MTTRKKKSTLPVTDQSIDNIISKDRTVFYCEIKRVSDLRDTFDTLKDALRDTIIKFVRPSDPDYNSGGMIINAFDKRSRALIKFKAYHTAFEEFYIDPAINEYSIGINVKSFATYIKQASNNDIIYMYLEKDKTDELTFMFKNPKGFTDFKRLKLYNLTEDPMEIPPAEFDCSITLKTEDFHKYVKDSGNHTEDINISFIDTKDIQDTIILSDPKKTTERRFTKQSNDVTIIKSTSDGLVISNTYKLKNLLIFCKMKTTYVSLLLTSNYPLLVSYNMEDFGQIVLILPPSTSDLEKMMEVQEDEEDEEDEEEEDIKKELCVEEDEEEDEEYI